jgi:pyruvyltransferase
MVYKKYIPLRLKNKIKNSLIFARIRVNILKKPIRIWFFREPGFLNFGDELTTDIIERLFSKKCELVDIDDADLYAVGSIIEVIDRKKSKKSYVWGSGFIRSDDKCNNKNLEFRAVRGVLSREGLEKKYNKIPLGDPGLLSSLIYERGPIRGKKIGIIPHYVDEEEDILAKAKIDNENYLIISVKDTPENVTKKITECKLILSSSLHGLIVSDSFNIPNVHLKLSDKLTGGDFKFKDYYSALNRDYKSILATDIYDVKKIDKLFAEYKPIENLKKIQIKLMKSFPF